MFRTIGTILKTEAVLLLIPIPVALFYREFYCLSGFLAAAFAALLAGTLMTHLKPDNAPMRARDGLVTVALSWIFLSLFGSMPFLLSGEIPNAIDAYFETVSQFTTTGATVFADVEILSRTLLFWRCLMQWFGGMGILIFMMAIMPTKNPASIHILRAESPGPSVNKIVPRIHDSARILYIIYLFLTFAEFVFLMAGGMSPYDSITHAFATACTGGFSTYNDGIAHFNSTYITLVITIFMVLFGTNFNIYFLILTNRFRDIWKDTEFRVYLGVLLCAGITIAINILHLYESLGHTVIDAAFSVASVMTTTGFTHTNYNIWPEYSKVILFLLMICGACAGSTSGSVKLARIILFVKSCYAGIRRLLSPRRVDRIYFSGKPVNAEVLANLNIYFVLYVAVYVISLILISLDTRAVEPASTSVLSMMSNILGPSPGNAAPTAFCGHYSALSKIIFCIDMMAGRLEIFPIVLLFFPQTWKRY